MNPSTAENLRNAGIVVAIAAVVTFVPGGDDTAAFVSALLFVGIATAFVLIAARLYRENRMTLEGLGDRHRGLLYGAVAALVVAMAARERLFETGPGTLAWIAVMCGAVYSLYLVWRHHREYEL